jgi:hypothetical protein
MGRLLLRQAESMIEIREERIILGAEKKARAATETAEDERTTAEQELEAATVSHFLRPDWSEQ